MNIAVHIDADALSTSFLWPHIQQMAHDLPQHRWVIFHSAKMPINTYLSVNCSFLRVKPNIKNSLLLHYWYQFKLPILLRKEKIDLFVTEHHVLSSRSIVPQLMVIRNEFFVGDKKSANGIYLRYQQKNFAKFIQQASGIIAVNDWVAALIKKAHPIVSQKTAVLHPLLQESFAPMLWEQRDSVLNLYSNDIEYFYCYQNLYTQPHMILLLKAFSLFKKRMKSSLQLVILQSTQEEPVKDFHLYKYRNDVHLHKAGDVAIEAAIAGAAFAGIFLQSDVLSDLSPMHCIKAGTVAIVPNVENNQQVLGDTVLYVDDGQQALADAMMLLYKDEDIKNKYLKAGETWLQGYQNAKNSRLFAQTISE
jgi:hypothetical protein